MRYLVMDTKPSYAILLDEMGHMVYAANHSYKVGESVENPDLLNTKIKRPWLKVAAITSPILAFACMILLFFNLKAPVAPTLFARIYLTINPEVVMYVDREGTVFKLEGLDEDGRTLIDAYDFNNKDEVKVTNELLIRAKEMAFLNEGMGVTIEIDNQEALAEFGSELRKEATNNLGFTVELQIVEKGALEKAEDVEITDPQKIPVTPSKEESPVETLPQSPEITTPDSDKKEPEPTQESLDDSNYQSSNYENNSSNYQASNYETDSDSDYDD